MRRILPRPPSAVSLSVQPHDLAAGWLIATLLVVGFLVLMMFMLWLTYALELTQSPARIRVLEHYSARGHHAKGLARDIEAPGAAEMEEEIEPTIQRQLQVVTDVISSQPAAFHSIATDATSTSSGRHLGDTRQRGPHGNGDDVIPRGQRWRIHYGSTSLTDYARQLDHFGIELAALGGGSSLVDYASDFSAVPRTRQTTGQDETRLYMSWSKGTLNTFDRILLGRANIATGGRICVQFYSNEIADTLVDLEWTFGKQNGRSSLSEFQRTVFGVRRKGTGFEYYVISQQYRSAE